MRRFILFISLMLLVSLSVFGQENRWNFDSRFNLYLNSSGVFGTLTSESSSSGDVTVDSYGIGYVGAGFTYHTLFSEMIGMVTQMQAGWGMLSGLSVEQNGTLTAEYTASDYSLRVHALISPFLLTIRPPLSSDGFELLVDVGPSAEFSFYEPEEVLFAPLPEMMNPSVLLAVQGNWWSSENSGISLRGQVNYTLLPLFVSDPIYRIVSFGVSVGMISR